MSDGSAPPVQQANSDAAGAGASREVSIWQGTWAQKYADQAEAESSAVMAKITEDPQPQQVTERAEPLHDYDLRAYASSPEDAEMFGCFGIAMEAEGLTQAQVGSAIQWYQWYDAEQEAQYNAAQQAFKDKSARTLRNEWGADYAANLRAVKDFLAEMPSGLRHAINRGPTEEGNLAGNDPTVIRWLLGLALGRVTRGDGGGRADVASELAVLKHLMGDWNSRYWKGPDAARLQARYRQLIGG